MHTSIVVCGMMRCNVIPYTYTVLCALCMVTQAVQYSHCHVAQGVIHQSCGTDICLTVAV